MLDGSSRAALRSKLRSLSNELSSERWKNDYVLSILVTFGGIYTVRGGLALARGQSVIAIREAAVAGLFFGTLLLCVVLPWISKLHDGRSEQSDEAEPLTIVRVISS